MSRFVEMERTKARRVDRAPTLDLDAVMARLRNAPREDILELVRFLLDASVESASIEQYRQLVDGAIAGVYFSQLPYPALEQVALSLPYLQLAPFCRINKTAAAFCQSSRFWRQKLERDYGITEMREETWRNSYSLARRNPPEWNVALVLRDGLFLFEELTPWVFSECTGLEFFVRLPVRNMSLDNVDALHFHGQDGYPVVFSRLGTANDGSVDFLRTTGGLGVNAEVVPVPDENANAINFRFIGQPVDTLNKEMYDQEMYDAWLERCAIDGFVLPVPTSVDPTIDVDKAIDVIVATLPNHT